MYLRLVRFHIDEDRLRDVLRLYESQLLPALQQHGGCRLAKLLQHTTRTSECVSMTLWESDQGARSWETSAEYHRILQLGSELLSAGGEWHGNIAPTAMASAVSEAFTLEAGGKTLLDDHFLSPLFLRVVSFRVRIGRWDELVQLYDSEVVPTLHETKGCRGAFLAESLADRDRGLSLSIWDREEDALRYELSGRFDALTRRLKKTLIPTQHWQAAFTSEGIAEGNPPTDGYREIAGSSP